MIGSVLLLLRTSLASPARHPRTVVVIGRLLGLGFLICFGTGLFSHLLQNPLPGMAFLTRPVWLYRVAQGVHVVVGTALIPVLLAKLWTVYPLLFAWPPVRSVASVLERASIALLVSASFVELATGLANTYQWYPWMFRFRETHFALAWAIVGALAIHIGVKLPVIARWWRRQHSFDAAGHLLPVAEGEGDLRPEPRVKGVTGFLQRSIDRAPKPPGRISRRTVLLGTGLASAAVVATTAGETLPALAPLNVLAPRRLRYGPQGLPVNRTAAEAKVQRTALDPAWRLRVRGPDRGVELSLDDLRAMPQTEAGLPIACVEGWSTQARWRGVPVRDLAALVGAGGRELLVRSFSTGAYSTTVLQREFADDPLTLVALELNGEVLHVDHGYPARLISPARPGVLQTKWLSGLEVR
ncbi:molybdopterin-dependent oxidoreductase [uncultured Amnibacterium sp.]|uniref:molybdopterin-dependent oxidoreductase n=1 Tax=uncultured Amnibacterium sp. TaxID=1631851 RepID=UPI0035C986BE